MKFTRKQVVFIAKWILAAAFDRMDASTPDVIGLQEYLTHKEDCHNMMVAAMDTAAMALAIFFAQSTGEGMGVWDWAGCLEFREACDKFIEERTDPYWKGNREYPDTEPFAELFANEWQETINGKNSQTV